MKSLSKPVLVAASLALGLMLVAVVWLKAEEPASPDASPTSSSPSSDKWEEIDKNNKEMTSTLDQIEQNLNFARIRSMSGGRNRS